jgi:hypothetical protein
VMKINCGAERLPRNVRVRSWHDHFALIPVRIGEHYHWLETIERKGEVVFVSNEYYYEWEFRVKD